MPRLVDLSALLALTDEMVRDPNLDTDLRDLIAVGSSLGGSRAHGADTVADALDWCDYFRVTRSQAAEMLAEILEETSHG